MRDIKYYMTNQEAVDALEKYFPAVPYEKVRYAAAMGVEALKKQIHEKPVMYGDSEDGKLLCPNCGEDLWDIKECGYNGCPYCLQAIDWGE